MTLDRWNPFRDLEAMRKEMDKIWEDIFPARRPDAPLKRPSAQPEHATATPAIDIIDRTGELVVRAEMPGVTKEDIDISLQDNVLTLKGEVKHDAASKDGNYAYSERNYSRFVRTVSIPFKIRQDGIKATLKDGVLSVQLPKVAEEQPRRITVEVS